jgi:uncharacterized protein (DUF2141 family)
MNLVMKMSLILATALSLPALASVDSAQAGDLRVLVTGIESDKGAIHCALFARDKGFPDRDGGVVQTKRYPALPPMLTCTFNDVEPGRYAVAVTHDANGDEQIDADFEDGSEEAWGVTNNVRPGRRAPKFSEAVIYLSEGLPSDYEIAIAR